MKERGSITVFITIVIAALLVVGLLVAEYAHIRFLFRKAQADQYLELDQALSDFERPLFQEMGLFAVSAKGEPFVAPLANQTVLDESIQALMNERLLVDLTGKAEDLVNQFLKQMTGIEFDLFDIQALNDELQQLLARDVTGADLPAAVAKFSAKLLAMKPYVELRGIDFQRLIDLLKNLKFEDIKILAPYFVIKDSVRDNYQTILETIQKYDFLGSIERYQRADYAVDYLGYSLTKSDQTSYHSEFLLTGLKTRSLRRAAIQAELFGLRLTLNLIEILVNPSLRNPLWAASLGNPGVFGLKALGLATIEATFDVRHLIDRKPVPLYKGQAGFLSHRMGMPAYSSGWNYPDYLKIMLMLLPSETYFNRLVEALEHNYDLDLETCFTGIRNQRKVTITSQFFRRDFVRELKGELFYVKPRLD